MSNHQVSTQIVFYIACTGKILEIPVMNLQRKINRSHENQYAYKLDFRKICSSEALSLPLKKSMSVIQVVIQLRV